MAILTFHDMAITAMGAAVPRTVVDNLSYQTDTFAPDDVRKVVEKTGIRERRFADATTCASDLCRAAAERMLADTATDRAEIDLLVSVTQTPDYRMPGNAYLLHHRLGLGRQCVALDLTLGCAGFLHVLSTVYALMQQHTLRKALLLDGDTWSGICSPRDRRTAFIFGDGATACLVERREGAGEAHFSLNSDGSLADLIRIEGGGYRHPSSAETLRERVVDEWGNRRSMEQAEMRGADVFNFVITQVPRDIRRLLDHAGTDITAPDYYVFHQANQYINAHLARKLRLDPARVPSTIARYGNTSSVSVPLTIASCLREALAAPERKTLLLSAFGVGMAWGSALVPFTGCRISEVVEV